MSDEDVSETDATVSRMLVGRTVQATSAFLFGIWLLLETGWVPDNLYGPLSPFWLPSYLAFGGASSMRNTVFSWLGSGFGFRAIVMFLTYVEAVLFAGLLRSLRTVYRRKRRTQAASF